MGPHLANPNGRAGGLMLRGGFVGAVRGLKTVAMPQLNVSALLVINA